MKTCFYKCLNQLIAFGIQPVAITAATVASGLRHGAESRIKYKTGTPRVLPPGTGFNIKPTVEKSLMALSKEKLLASKILIWFLFRFIRIYSWTLHLRVENEAQWRDHLEANGRVLLCCWHQQFFSFIRHFRSYRKHKPSLMISKSSDGEIIAGVATLSGWHAVRGSSSTGGREALALMIARLRETGLAAHILDGPRGPIGQVKNGAVYLAQNAEACIVPVYAIADNAWIFNSWDRFLLPKPFSQVIIRFGEMVTVPRTSDPDQFEVQRKKLEDTMLPNLIR